MKNWQKYLENKFGVAFHGISWALNNIEKLEITKDQLKVNNKLLILSQENKIKDDSFEIKTLAKEIRIISGTAIGMIAGLLDLAKAANSKKIKNKSQRFQFKTRIYKYELGFKSFKTVIHRNDGMSNGLITDLPDEFMERFFQEIVSRHFNSLMIYSGYHPFEYFLDYKGFQKGTNLKTVKIRAQNYEAFKRFLDFAKKYGLQTFLQHYVSHFTQELADNLKLNLKESGGRLASVNHPEVDRYNCYIYQRTLKVLPSLDGYAMNFESCGNNKEFIIKTLLKTLNTFKKKPPLLFRLWGISDVAGMKEIFQAYKGQAGFIHKGHETSDVYYYPVADDRIKVWKKSFPAAEFIYSFGPCHNCGTNISDKLWTDGNYIKKYLLDAQKKGADSISFQSSYDLLYFKLADLMSIPQGTIEHGQMNIGHLESFVAYVRNEEPELSKVYANVFNTSLDTGEIIKKTIHNSSQIILKMYYQFFYSSNQEGYLYPGRFTLYQEPFFNYPMAFLNRIGEIKYNIAWLAWVCRDKKIKVVPNDTQACIDFVNPTIKYCPPNNPDALAKQINSHVNLGKKQLKECKKALGLKMPKRFEKELLNNILNGERIWREIEIANHLFSCYFIKDKKSFFKHLKSAKKLMIDLNKILGEKGGDIVLNYRATKNYDPFQLDKDADQLQNIIDNEKSIFSIDALKFYLKSHERYNEIRRLNRAYVSVKEENVIRNKALLKESLKYADKSLNILLKSKSYLNYENVLSWKRYLNAELEWLVPPAMECLGEEQVEKEVGFREMVHDQNYRWGEFCWEDFASFFKYQDFFREDKCDCRVVYTKAGLVLSLREHDINWKQRKKKWDENRGTVNQNGFMRIYLDPDKKGKDLIEYIIYFEGYAGTVRGRHHGSKPKMMTGVKTTFTHTDSNWRIDVVIPWNQLGGKPKKGSIWGLNILTNAPVLRNRQVAWCQGYEFNGNDAARLGNIIF